MERPNYLKAAFFNVYNLSLVGGALAASLATGEHVLGAVALGAEALWLLFAPDAHPFRRMVDRWTREEEQAKERERLTQLVKKLPEREWARARALDELRKEIERDIQQNPSFQALLIEPEIAKLEQLFSSFVSLATACVRAETYLANTDSRDLARQIEVQRGVERSMKDATVQELARKNIEVLTKRQVTMGEIQNFLARARGQMNLIENTVRLLRDQVLTMASPDQLGEQLDDLIQGVDAIQATAKEHESLLGIQPVEDISPVSEGTEKAPRIRE